MSTLSKLFIFLLLIPLFIFLYTPTINAQTSGLGVAIDVPMTDLDILDASLVCNGEEGIVACVKEYQDTLLGVVTDNPSVSLDNTTQEGRLLVTDGRATVKVSAKNGSILKGDYITASDIPGIGQKAVSSGQVIGIALTDFDSSNPDEIGEVDVVVDPHFETSLETVGSDLLQALRKGFLAAIFQPASILRYIIAAILIIISFVLGFFFFGRISQTGVEAIGRNPLAKGVIQRSVYSHILITIFIIFVGFGGAYLILAL